MAYAIETTGLTKKFIRRRKIKQIVLHPLQRETITALDRIDLQIKEGELSGILGPNGAGKTTLIKVLSTLILPLAKKKGLGVTIMKPFGGGILAERPSSGGVSISPIQALKFVISNPNVDTTTPGIANIEELEEDVKAGDPSISLSEEEMVRLQAYAMQWGPNFCQSLDLT